MRVEQTILGLDQLNPAAEGQVRITILPNPLSGAVYTLDARARTFALGGRGTATNGIGGGHNFAVPLRWFSFLTFARGDQSLLRYGIDESAIQEERLGTQTIAGVEASGRRITTTVPAGSRVGNDRPMKIVDERWEASDLQLLISARHSNPLTGVVEYQLSNIRRGEPPSHLFRVPGDYTEIRTTRDDPFIELKHAEAPQNQKAAPIRR